MRVRRRVAGARALNGSAVDEYTLNRMVTCLVSQHTHNTLAVVREVVGQVGWPTAVVIGGAQLACGIPHPAAPLVHPWHAQWQGGRAGTGGNAAMCVV